MDLLKIRLYADSYVMILLLTTKHLVSICFQFYQNLVVLPKLLQENYWYAWFENFWTAISHPISFYHVVSRLCDTAISSLAKSK